MKAHLWEVNHPYHCTTSNYYTSEDLTNRHRTWAEFLAEFGDNDLDYNLVFRWDWQEGADHDLPEYNGDDNYRHAELRINVFYQRKGYHSTQIIEVCRADEPAVIEFLRKRLAYLQELWEPLAIVAPPALPTAPPGINGLTFHPDGQITVQGEVAATTNEDGSVTFDPGPVSNAYAGLLADAIVGRGLATPAHALWAFDRGLVQPVGDNQRAASGWGWRMDVLHRMTEPELEFIYLQLLKAVPQ